MKIDLSKVASVYSGINGRCCCGCSGKYSYAAAHRDFSTKDRGYEVRDEEISDRSVKLICSKVEKVADAELLSDTQITAVVGNRLYMVMLSEPIAQS
jgi:hypothetical protein